MVRGQYKGNITGEGALAIITHLKGRRLGKKGR